LSRENECQSSLGDLKGWVCSISSITPGSMNGANLFLAFGHSGCVCTVGYFSSPSGLHVRGVPAALARAAACPYTALVGPGLLLSNVIVKFIQAARARTRLEPLLRFVIAQLRLAVTTSQQACDMLGISVSLDVLTRGATQPPAIQNLTLHRLETALNNASAALPPVAQQPNFPGELEITTPLNFPSYSMVLRLIRQMDQILPMPWTITSANIADNWSERCGVDFSCRAGVPDHPGTRDRAVGLTQINHQSTGVMQGTTVTTGSYIEVVDWCLNNSRTITSVLRGELPPPLRR
jgi:hypothetical protein